MNRKPVAARREFLSIGGASVALAMVPSGLAWATQARDLQVRVGYWPGSEGLTAPPSGEGAPPLISAEALESGDATLAARGLLVHVQGLFPQPVTGSPLDQVELRVGFGGSPGHEAHAWSLVQRGGAPNVSAPVTLRVNVAGSGGLRLSGSVVPRGADPKAPLAYSEFLSLGASGAKLRQGLYVLQFEGLTAPGTGLVFSIAPIPGSVPPPAPGNPPGAADEPLGDGAA